MAWVIDDPQKFRERLIQAILVKRVDWVACMLRQLDRHLTGGSGCCGTFVGRSAEDFEAELGRFLDARTGGLTIYLDDCGLSALRVSKEYDGEIVLDLESLSEFARSRWLEFEP